MLAAMLAGMRMNRGARFNILPAFQNPLASEIPKQLYVQVYVFPPLLHTREFSRDELYLYICTTLANKQKA